MRQRSAAGDPPRPPGEAQIDLRDVTRNNLHHLDVEIPRGRLTVLTGVSGSGKSSLLAVLAGQVDAEGGRVVFVDQAPAATTTTTIAGDPDHVIPETG